MKRFALVAALLGVCVLALAGVATAGKVGLAKTWVHDNDNTPANTASATWTKDGLSLQKNAPTTAELAAGVQFKGLEGQTLTKLSFDVKNGTYCGAGAPRFNVDTDQGLLYFGCTYGVHTNLGNGWTRVVFDGTEPGGGAFGVIKGVDVVQDEQGQTLLRNITVNNIAVDKFPHS